MVATFFGVANFGSKKAKPKKSAKNLCYSLLGVGLSLIWLKYNSADNQQGSKIANFCSKKALQNLHELFEFLILSYEISHSKKIRPNFRVQKARFFS